MAHVIADGINLACLVVYAETRLERRLVRRHSLLIAFALAVLVTASLVSGLPAGWISTLAMAVVAGCSLVPGLRILAARLREQGIRRKESLDRT